MAHSLADHLIEKGCGGRRVAILLPNGGDLHIAYLAALLARATPALINPAYPAAHIHSLLSIAEPRLIIAPRQMAATMNMPACIEIFSLDRDLLLSTKCSAELAHPEITDPAVLLFTGGTTGLPKGVVHSHIAMANAVRAMEYIWPTRATGEIWLPIAPMSHIYGFLMGVLNPVYGVAQIVVPARFKPELLIDLIERNKVTVLGGGPATIYAGLLAAKNRRAADMSSLAVCPAGGASIPMALMERWKAETGLQIYEAYGMTEIAPIAGSSEHAGQKNGSVGRALPLNEIEIVDPETGKGCLPPGARGEIRARGPSAMTGYLGQPSETANTLRDGWVYTGDIGYLDEEGFLFVTDRKKDMAIVKGFNVFPRLVEEAILAHPHVSAVTVIGVPDADNGERLIAFVAAGESLDDTELRRHAASHLASYMIPAEFQMVDELPVTAAGKPDREALRNMVINNDIV